jgi:hypothetical protein
MYLIVNDTSRVLQIVATLTIVMCLQYWLQELALKVELHEGFNRSSLQLGNIKLGWK